MAPPPRPASPLVGRAAELARIAGLLRDGERLVSLVGPAGIGKTRLSLEVAAIPSPRGGVRFVDLTGARGVAGLQAAVARAIGVAAPGAGGTLLPLLARRPPTLLVLDSFEHLVPVAEVVERWIEGCPELQVLVTSRERLHLDGEVVVEVGPLSLPTDSDDGEALGLWVALQRRAAPEYELGSDRAEAEELVRRLDGMPLAIELAATRAPLLGTRALLDRLGDRFAVLRERDRTLVDALEWSWSLLGEEERRALAVLSMFRGGFDLAGAEAVLGEGDAAALDLLASLRDKSLLTTHPSEAGAPPRFGMLLSVREHAARKLEARADRGAHVRAFLACFARLAGRCTERLESPEGTAALAELRRERLNLRAAAELGLSLDAGDENVLPRVVDVLEGLDAVLWADGPLGEHADLLDRAIVLLEARAPSDLALARALELRGLTAGAAGRVPEGIEDFERATSLVDAAPGAEPELRARSALRLAWALAHTPDTERVTDVLAEADRRFAALEDGDRRAAWPPIIRASLLQRLGRLEEAEAAARAARTRYEETGCVRWLGVSWLRLATLARERCDLDGLRFAARRALGIHRRDPHFAYVEGIALTSLAAGEHAAGAVAEARRLYAEVLPLHESMRQHMLVGTTRAYDGLAAFERGEIEGGLDRLEAGIRTLLRANAAAFAARFMLLRALLFATLGRRDDALAMIERIHAMPALPGREQLLHWIHTYLERGAPPEIDEPGSVDLRIAARLLRQACTDEEPEPSGLRVEAGGAFLLTPAGERVDLRSRPVTRRIVLRLGREREAAPGEPVSSDELIAAGWPGDRSSADSARNRLYVAMRRLRDLGLAQVVEAVPGGYRLDPEVPFAWDRRPPEGGPGART